MARFLHNSFDGLNFLIGTLTKSACSARQNRNQIKAGLPIVSDIMLPGIQIPTFQLERPNIIPSRHIGRALNVGTGLKGA